MFIIRESSSPKITDLKVIAEYAPGQEGNLEQLQKEISNYCKAHVRCNPTIEWAEPETLPRYARKTPVMMKRY